MCVTGHWCVWQDPSTCVTWLIHVCDVTYSYVWHDLYRPHSFACMTCVWQTFMCATLLIHMYDVCDKTHPHVCGIIPTMSDMTHKNLIHLHVWCNTNGRGQHHSFRVTDTYVCDDTHLYVWHDSFTCAWQDSFTCVWHDSFTCVWRHSLTCVPCLLYVCPFTCVTWRMYAHLHVWHDSLMNKWHIICVPCLLHVCPSTCVPWLMYAQLHVWHDALTSDIDWRSFDGMYSEHTATHCSSSVCHDSCMPIYMCAMTQICPSTCVTPPTH